MIDICEHDTFKDICAVCHRITVITNLTDENARLTADNERLKRSRDRYRVAWEEEKRRFTAARAALSGDKHD